MNVGDLFLGLKVDPSGDLKAAVTKAGTDAGTSGGAALGKSMTDSLSRAMASAGAVIGTGLASSVQAFVKFDDQMRSVYTLLPGISEQAMTEMEGQVKGLAVEMGRLPEDIIPGLYDALSSGIPQDNVFAFMESAAKAAVAGGANTQETVKVLAATINAFGLDAAETTGLTDSFFNAINRGVTTFPELASSMSQVTPTAAAMGLSIEDVLAAITAMTLQGTPTAQAVTGINASLIALQRTTPQMEAALKALGYETGQAALDALGYQGTMEALADEAKRTGVPLIELTGRVEGSAAMLQLTGENAAKAGELLDTFGETAGTTAAAFETMEGGVGGSARRLAAQIKVTMIDIGEQFQSLGPLFTAFGPTMGRLLGASLGAAGGIVARGISLLAPHISTALQGVWATVAKSRAVTAAAEVASRAATAAYSAAMKIADAIGKALSSAWDAIIGSAPVKAAIARAALAGNKAYALAAAGVAALSAAISGAWGLVANSSVVQKASDLAGTKMGGIMGKAAGIGLALGLAAAAPEIEKAITPIAQDAGRKFFGTFGDEAKGLAHGTVFDTVFDGVHDMWDAIGDADPFQTGAPQAMGEIARAAGEAVGPGIQQGAQSGVEQLDTYMRQLGERFPDSIGQGVVASGNTLADHFGNMFHGQIGLAEGMALADARELGAGIPGEIGEGMQSTANQVLDAAQGLRDLLKNGLSPEARALQIIGGDYVKLVAQGMKSAIDGARESAIQVAAAAINTIEDAGLTGVKGGKGLAEIGRLYDTLFAGGLKDYEIRALLAAADVSDATIDALEAGEKPAGDAGEDEGEAFVDGILTNKRDAGDAGETLAGAAYAGTLNEPWGSGGANAAKAWTDGFIKGIGTKRIRTALDQFSQPFRGDSPPKVGPLRHIDQWGENIGTAWLDGVRKSLSGAGELLNNLTAPLGRGFGMSPILMAGGTATMELHHTVDIHGDSGNLDNRKVADMLNEGAAGFAWNLEHAMSAVTSG